MRRRRLHRVLDSVSAGRRSHGPVHHLLGGAAETGVVLGCFAGCLGSSWPPVPAPSRCLVQHLPAALHHAWLGRVSADLSERQGIRDGMNWDILCFSTILFLVTRSLAG